VRLVVDGSWSGNQGIPRLRELLLAGPVQQVPSCDSLARLVEELYLETGEQAFLIKRRRPRHAR
jgi:hypothetical protein